MSREPVRDADNIWADEGGGELLLRRDGTGVRVGIIYHAHGNELESESWVTVSSFRHKRIADFFAPLHDPADSRGQISHLQFKTEVLREALDVCGRWAKARDYKCIDKGGENIVRLKHIEHVVATALGLDESKEGA